MADQEPTQGPEPRPSEDQTGRWPPQPMAVWPYTMVDVRWPGQGRRGQVEPPQPSRSAPTAGAPTVLTSAAPAPSAPAATPEAPAPSPSGTGQAPAAPPRRPGLHRRAAQQPVTGQQIRERRKALGWTQAQLAEKVGLSRPFIALVEQGRRILSPDDLARVREALGI